MSSAPRIESSTFSYSTRVDPSTRHVTNHYSIKGNNSPRDQLLISRLEGAMPKLPHASQSPSIPAKPEGTIIRKLIKFMLGIGL